MKFILFVEGQTEQKFIPSFLKRWLDPQLKEKVGIQPVLFRGWPEMKKEAPVKTRLHLGGPASDKIIAVIGLLDLYGPDFYPSDKTSADEREKWATKYFEENVQSKRFRMFFAVHEIEAWLLSDPQLFPLAVKTAVQAKSRQPEKVNFNVPPSKLLGKVYWSKLRRSYIKTVHGRDLFSRLDPERARGKCPRLKRLLDEMLAMAKNAGL